MAKPPHPPSTDEKTRPTLLDDVDKMTPQELADFLYALAEEVISNPLEYKLKLGLTQIDISEFDNIDLSTPAGRKKLAALFRLLAEQVLKGKEIYQSTVVDKSKQQRQR
jgi:hypothetical protein